MLLLKVQPGPVPKYRFFCLSARDTVCPIRCDVEILMAPGGKPSCLTTLPAVRHCQSQCEPADSQTHPAGGPWEASGSLMDLCGRFRPVGPPRSSCDAYVGRVCHCHCGSDRSSWHPVRLVWVNGSFGCRTIAARTRNLILDTILAVTNSYSTVLSYCGIWAA